VPGAELWIDGRHAAFLPLRDSLRVVAGMMVIEVRASGYDTVRRKIDVSPEEHAHESMTLVTYVAPDQREGAPGSTQRAIGWVAIGSGAALLVGGAVAHVVRQSAASTYNDDSQCLAGSQTREEKCGGYRTTATTAQTLMFVGYIGGAAAVLGGVAL